MINAVIKTDACKKGFKDSDMIFREMYWGFYMSQYHMLSILWRNNFKNDADKKQELEVY